MAGIIEDHIKDILGPSGAPELVETPGLTVGLAQGISSPASGLVEGRSVSRIATVAAWHKGVVDTLDEMRQAGLI